MQPPACPPHDVRLASKVVDREERVGRIPVAARVRVDVEQPRVWVGEERVVHRLEGGAHPAECGVKDAERCWGQQLVSNFQRGGGEKRPWNRRLTIAPRRQQDDAHFLLLGLVAPFLLFCLFALAPSLLPLLALRAASTRPSYSRLALNHVASLFVCEPSEVHEIGTKRDGEGVCA